MKKLLLTTFALFAALQLCFAQWTTSGTNIYNSTTGNVGVGTANPVGKLDVVGESHFSQTLYSDPAPGFAYAIKVGNSGIAVLGNSFFQNNLGVGIIDTHGYKLAVNGAAIATSMKVKLQADWPDFVFHKDYNLPTLAELQRYINDNKHLPDIPSASEVHTNGLDLGEMNRLLLKKVEELTLYLIEKNQQIEHEEKQNSEQQKRIDQLEHQITRIEALEAALNKLTENK